MKYTLSDDTWNNEEREAINEVINSNQFTMGHKTLEFEILFASYFNTKYAIMVNSGSSANLLAIASLVYSGILQKGDEVIVPAVSWSTSYFPLFQHGLKLIFVDIDINTLNLDLKKIENAVSSKTKAILAVNLLGNPNDFDKLIDICSANDLILIEDNCESLGAIYKDKYCGTFGLIGTFSTFFSHHICTMEGGVVLTDDEILYHYMLSIRAHGWTRNLPKNSRLHKKNDDEFYDSYNFILPGYNLRPLEIQAAIGVKQIHKINKIINNRRINAGIFVKLFQDHPNLIIQSEIGKSSWFGFSIVLLNKLEGKRDQVIKTLIHNGIEVRPIVAGNFTKNDVIKFLDYEIIGKLVNANYIHDNGFFVGNHSKLIEKELIFLSEIINQF